MADDQIVLESPVADTRAVLSGYSLTTIGGTSRLSAIIKYEDPRQYEPVDHYIAYGFDLGRKTQLFSPFKLDNNRSGLHRGPAELILSPDDSYGLVRFNNTTSWNGKDPIDKTLDRLFEGYDTRTGQRLVSFGGQNGDKPEAGVIDRSVLSQDGQMIVGLWHRGRTREGGLVVLDAHNGAVRQRIRFGEMALLAPMRVTLSPDGTRLASFTNYNEIRLYRIRQ